MAKGENRGNWNKVEMFSYLVPAYCTAQMIPDKAIEVPEQIPSASLVAYGKVFCDPFGKPGGKAPKTCRHARMDELMDE
tara:strand:+ start:213 stop:449 length:237 start_codon:yes stop_codon:yes gene_type:complete